MSKRLKIAVIASTYPRTDDDVAVPWLRQEVKQTVERGYEVTVFAPAYKGQPSHLLDDVPVHRFRYFLANKEDLTHDSGAPSKVHKASYFILSGFYLIMGTFAFTKLYRRERFDVVHVHWPFPHANFLALIKRNRKFKIVLNFHGAELALAKKFGFVKKNLAARVREADAVISNSGFTAGIIRDTVGETPIHVIPFGCPIEIDPSAKRKVPQRPVILYVGRLIERKGVQYLIEAFELLIKECDAELWIVGSGFLQEDLSERIRARGLESSISLLTDVGNDEIAERYLNSTAFVLPAIIDSKGDTEGLGVVLIEALSFGLPVIASNVGGIPDVIIDGKTGLLVPEKDPVALKNAMLRVIQDPKLGSELVANGRLHVENTFSWRAVIDRLDNLYQGLADPK